MEGGVVEGNDITRHWKYLGAAAVCPHPEAAVRRAGWTLASLMTVQVLSWAPA